MSVNDRADMSLRTDSPCAIRDNHRGPTISKALTRSEVDIQGSCNTDPSSVERNVAISEFSLCLKDLHTFSRWKRQWLLDLEAAHRKLCMKIGYPDDFRFDKTMTATATEVSLRGSALFWGVKILTGKFLPTEIFNIIEGEIERLSERETRQLIQSELQVEQNERDESLMIIRLRRLGYIMQWKDQG